MVEFTFTSSGHKYTANLSFEEALELMTSNHKFPHAKLRELIRGTRTEIKIPNGKLTAYVIPVK